MPLWWLLLSLFCFFLSLFSFHWLQHFGILSVKDSNLFAMEFIVAPTNKIQEKMMRCLISSDDFFPLAAFMLIRIRSTVYSSIYGYCIFCLLSECKPTIWISIENTCTLSGLFSAVYVTDLCRKSAITTSLLGLIALLSVNFWNVVFGVSLCL